MLFLEAMKIHSALTKTRNLQPSNALGLKIEIPTHEKFFARHRPRWNSDKMMKWKRSARDSRDGQGSWRESWRLQGGSRWPATMQMSAAIAFHMKHHKCCEFSFLFLHKRRFSLHSWGEFVDCVRVRSNSVKSPPTLPSPNLRIAPPQIVYMFPRWHSTKTGALTSSLISFSRRLAARTWEISEFAS
jgi:hypothetical protein